jgi:hypothetical protein
MAASSGSSADNYRQCDRPSRLGMVGNAHCLFRGLFVEVWELQAVITDISICGVYRESGTHFGGQIGLPMVNADRAVRG